MSEDVIYHSETVSEGGNTTRAQDILTSIFKVILKILLAVLIWAILTASFFVL